MTMDETADESQSAPQHFTPIQTRRFRTPIPCWSLCPSMDLLGLGSGSAEAAATGCCVAAADSVTVYRIVSWQRLLALSNKELTSHEEGGDDDWDLAEDGCRAPVKTNDDESINHDSIHGATSLTWSPDGRLIAIGLQDGGVLIRSVEVSEKEDEGEEKKSMHIIRTAFHAREEVTVEEKPPRNNVVDLKKITFSPRVTRSMAAKQQRDETPESKEATPQKKQPSRSTAVIGMTWKRVAPYHSSWPLSSDEWERRESWKYTSQLIHRGNKFLPPECYHNTAANEKNLFSPLAHLNVLCVATQNELHWYLQSRYRIMSNTLNFWSPSSIKGVNMVCSPDLSTVLCVAEHQPDEKGTPIFSSRVRVFSCPLLASKRFDLQILAASYRSIFSRLKSVKIGMQSALVSWGSALRPLDMKFQRLFQLFRNYNVVTTDFEVSSTSQAIREELLRFILSGRSTVVGDASNALDQFFTRADMHDQLLLREAGGIKASLGSIESKLRTTVQSEIRALVYETDELYGIIKTHEVTAADSILVEVDVALKLYTTSRILFLTFERFMAHVVDARSRVNDFLAWIRGTATEIRARGTAADSILRQLARDRRCPHGVVCRVSDFLSTPMQSPNQCITNDGNLDHRKLTECIIGVPLSDNLAANTSTSVGPSIGELTLNSAHLNTFHAAAAVFDQPRNIFSRSLYDLDLTFVVEHKLIALHTRIGANYDEPLGDGYFSPQINADNMHLHSPYWIFVARIITSSDGGNVLEINAIPSDVLDNAIEPTAGTIHVCLQAHLRIDDGCEVLSMAFYSDDGNSSLSPNLDIDAESMEGRQSLGLIVKNGMNEELWKFQYNNVFFELCDLDMDNRAIRISTKADQGDWPILSTITDEEGESNLKRRVIGTRDPSNVSSQISQLGVCGSRGTGGVLAFGASNSLEIFDMEEDEEGDDDSDVVVDDVD